MSAERDPYSVLGVDRAAEPESVARAYRTLARHHHPDVSQDPGAEARMAEINAAWAILRDPVRRAAYDREHYIAPGRREGRADNPLWAIQERAKSTSPAEASTAPSQPSPGRQPTGRSGEVTWHRGPDGEGAAGPPPGNPRGSVLPFGRHIGWSLGEIVRVDPGYLQWLDARPEGRPYRAEIEVLLAPMVRTADGSGFMNHAGADRSKHDRSRR